MTSEDLIAEARRWIGTPYRHGASIRGLGCDCLGLVVGVRHALAGGKGPAPMPSYAPDWAEASRCEHLARACERELVRCAQGPSQVHLQIHPQVHLQVHSQRPAPGDLVLFRWRDGRPASHLAIASHDGAIIHAHVRAIVAEVPLTPPWRRRIAALYRFPEIA